MKNRLKSFFIGSYGMLLMGLVCFSVWKLLSGASLLAWCGVLLGTVPMLIFFSRLMIFRSVARTSARLPTINFLAASGVLLAALAWSENRSEVTSLAMSIAGWAGFLLYAYWYSSFAPRLDSKLKIGDPLPAFVLKAVDEQIHHSQQFLGRLTILIFFRGNWCPLCMAQIKEVAALYRELSSLGVRVALISSQPHTETKSLAQSFDVNFDFFTDEGNAAAKILGIEQQNGLPAGMQVLGYDSDTVLPTVVIVDVAGAVIWKHETDNYRVRPEPSVFLDVLRRYGAVG